PPLEDVARQWATVGIRECRQASLGFDAKTYLSLYVDLRNAFGTDCAAAAEHFINYGHGEKRAGSLTVAEVFDWRFYLDFYPDLRAAGIKDQVAAANHWLQFGMAEQRQASLTFSISDYKIAN